ncbi:hypothetical protein [Paractinoplanes lichenicola]|uniref:Protein kinase domain-containing protein n=1 Tax=Paractinoplanes lichenicola TaxID=2802976 RepID=A0ABS1VU83_9ACTN|nr:hypothetical protein [Actinoplanes lichenicola]MBL7258041.1 hypothetical protein [Actinoplanes lichenicola]
MNRDVWIVRGDGTRTPDRLGDPVGSVGSQGEVRQLEGDPGRIAKIVHHAGDLSDRVRLMLRDRPGWVTRAGRPVVAWPDAAVHRSDDGRLIGYAAPKLAPPRFVPLPLLFNPAVRARLLPAATWTWWLEVAEDLARTVHAAHQRDHVIGDLAPANIFVSAAGTACLIDVDGWQLRDETTGTDLLCAFSRPEYTAPEELGKPARPRDPASDRWALAVLVAQLLSLGFHPYGGVPFDASGPVEEVDNVRARRCRPLGARVRAPRGAVPADVLPPVLRRRLAEALDDGYDRPEARPDASAWAAGLAYSRRRLTTCERSARHVHAVERAGCPWCSMAAGGGRDPFREDL